VAGIIEISSSRDIGVRRDDARCGSRGLCGPNPQARSRANRAKNLLTVSSARSVYIRCRRHRYDTPAGNRLDWLISLTLIGPRKRYRRTNFRTARFGVAREEHKYAAFSDSILNIVLIICLSHVTLRRALLHYGVRYRSRPSLRRLAAARKSHPERASRADSLHF